MTIRWRLNLSVIALVTVFLVAAAFSIRAVGRHGGHSRMFSRMRDQSQQTADIRALIYQHLAADGKVIDLPEELSEEKWPDFVLEDIDVQVRLAKDDAERELWKNLRLAVAQLGRPEDARESDGSTNALVNRIEKDLRRLRNYYDLTQYNLSVAGAKSSLVEYAALCVACGVTTILFLVYLIMVRDWLVKPIEILRASADTIGSGQLDHRVPLGGNDELAALARDIDEMAARLARHQEALVETREMSAIGELCGNIAHGLRNPLATIRATAQLAERRLQGQEQFESMMRDLTGQADRMDRRITKLFDFSRTVQLRKGAVTLADIASQARSHAHSFMTERRVDLRVDDQTKNAEWNVDRDQLAEALAELVTNAVHHSPPNSEVVLAARLLAPDNGSGPGLQIDITDQGAGMEQFTLDKAFDAFFTSRPTGSGMGLTLVRRIVDRHGGQISIRSAPNKGTTVTITLRGAAVTAPNGHHVTTQSA